MWVEQVENSSYTLMLWLGLVPGKGSQNSVMNEIR